MPDFNSLPNELVLQIVRLLPPEDLESFTSTCKLINKLAGKLLDEHRIFKRKYQHCSPSALVPNYRHLFGLLKDVLENPRIALYVQYLDIDELNTEWVKDESLMSDADDDLSEADDDADPDEPFHTDEMSEKEVELFQNAIRESLYVSENEIDSWWNSIIYGEDDAILALLVTLLPNLKILGLRIVPDSGSLFYETIRRISAASSLPGSSAPLSRLSGVAMHLTNVETEMGRFIHIGCLWPFFALPSMRSVMGAGIRHSELIPLAARSSDVVQVDWTEPYDFTPAKIRNFFSKFKALQSFRLTPREPDISSNWDDGAPITLWNVRAIRNSLVQYARHSLVELHLCTDDRDETGQKYIGGLRAFDVLKRIKINVVALLGERGPSRKPLAPMLPISSEDVTIQDDSVSRKEYRSLVLELLSVKHLALPNLKLLSFQESFFDASVVITDGDLGRMCRRRAGFTLTVSQDVSDDEA